MNDDRVPAWLEPHAPLCQAVAALFHPLVEVTVHDLRRDRVVASWNGGGRTGAASAGAASAGTVLAGLAAGVSPGGVLGPAPAALPGGRVGAAVGVVLANSKGLPRGLLAIIFDRSPLDEAIALLGSFAAPQPPQPPPAVAVWGEQIGAVVAEESRAAGLRVDRLTRAQRLTLVRALDQRGLFATRHATAHAARALGVSRTTVYDLLKEARS